MVVSASGTMSRSSWRLIVRGRPVRIVALREQPLGSSSSWYRIIAIRTLRCLVISILRCVGKEDSYGGQVCAIVEGLQRIGCRADGIFWRCLLHGQRDEFVRNRPNDVDSW